MACFRLREVKLKAVAARTCVDTYEKCQALVAYRRGGRAPAALGLKSGARAHQKCERQASDMHMDVQSL